MILGYVGLKRKFDHCLTMYYIQEYAPEELVSSVWNKNFKLL